ncbi:MAG: hypothetical protein JST85_20540 [Acidobacteria bacterium]|nr:hypothetical protein [Acidobacteriota bacterium]
MAKSKKRKRLEESGLLDSQARLSKEQSTALESLTPEEVEALISARDKLKNAFFSPGVRSSSSGPSIIITTNG